MSHGSTLVYSPTLLNLMWIGAPWHALAFCRTRSVRALGAARARVLHVRAHGSPHPAPGPCSPAEPRPSSSTHQSAPSPPLAPYSAAARAPLAARRRRQRALPWMAPPKPPAHASCPGEQPVLILLLVGTRSSPPRRPAATATATRRRYYPPPQSQPRRAIKGGPVLLRALRQPQATPIVSP